MQFSLKIGLSATAKEAIDRNKRIWNFVKNDLANLFQGIDSHATITIHQEPDNTFRLTAQERQFHIGPDFTFADGLVLESETSSLIALLLAVVMRLAKTYKNSFYVSCNAYSVVDDAQKLLAQQLQLRVSRSWLASFMDCPFPGRRPKSIKPLTNVEIRRGMIRKKRAEGKCSVSTWLTQEVKDELDAFCKNQGLNLEQALNQLIPIGIKTTCSVLQNFRGEPK